MLSNKIGKIPHWLIRRVRRAFIVIGSLLMVELRGKMHDFLHQIKILQNCINVKEKEEKCRRTKWHFDFWRLESL